VQYVNSIYNYYYRVEGATSVGPTYMANQADINDKMRAILVDWLVEVHLKFKLMPETLFLTVNLIDRYLAVMPVTRRNLQLVGVTAMLLASKYEEIWAPEVRDFVYISDKAYTRDQILDCEKGMLNTLGFHLTVPTPFQFLTRLTKAANGDKPLSHLAQYYMELALPEYSLLHFKGSMIAAAALYCAIRVMRDTQQGSPDGWTYALARHRYASSSCLAHLYSALTPSPPSLCSRYTEADLLPCAHALIKIQRKAATASLTAVHKKYCNPKFYEVARMASPEGLGEDA
jgi:cyclin B